jgi:hypothetical protein
MLGRFDQDHFERRPDARFEQVAAVRRAVGLSDDNVRVDFRLTLIERDVADERESFDLIGERNCFVVFPLAVEIPQRDVA